MKKELLILSIIFTTIIISSFFLGYYYRQKEVLESAKEVMSKPKTTYSVEDIEIIVFK